MDSNRLLIATTSWLVALFAGAAIAAATPHPPDIDPANFIQKAPPQSQVTNPFFPLKPGTTFCYRGTKEGVPTTNETHVTKQRELIMGVWTTVVHDQAFENGVLVEDTLDFYAQDLEGNVWYFGEDTRELDPQGNVISTEGSWLAGQDDADPGLIMEANPQVGDRYFQEFAPNVAEDQAQVLGLQESACVTYGCFHNLLLTKETTRLDPGVVENKYYARTVGFILGVNVKGGNERSELVGITTGNCPR